MRSHTRMRTLNITKSSRSGLSGVCVFDVTCVCVCFRYLDVIINLWGDWNYSVCITIDFWPLLCPCV